MLCEERCVRVDVWFHNCDFFASCGDMGVVRSLPSQPLSLSFRKLRRVAVVCTVKIPGLRSGRLPAGSLWFFFCRGIPTQTGSSLLLAAPGGGRGEHCPAVVTSLLSCYCSATSTAMVTNHKGGHPFVFFLSIVFAALSISFSSSYLCANRAATYQHHVAGHYGCAKAWMASREGGDNIQAASCTSAAYTIPHPDTRFYIEAVIY